MCDHLQKATTYPKHQNVSSLSLIVGISSKRPRPLFRKADLEFPLFLTSSKRPFDIQVSRDLCVYCIDYATQSLRRTFRNNMDENRLKYILT